MSELITTCLLNLSLEISVEVGASVSYSIITSSNSEVIFTVSVAFSIIPCSTTDSI